MATGGGRLAKPVLPDGPLKDLNDALHELLRRAGRPSVRDLERDMRKLLPASHTRIYDVFSRDRLPDLELLSSLVQVIAGRAGRLDSCVSPDEEGERFYQLWMAADEHDHHEKNYVVPSPALLPVYMVVEESSAVVGSPVKDLNAGILQLCAEIASNPVVADKMRFCLIGFSSQAHVILPLSDLSEISALSGLVAGGTACYGAAFDLLRATIDRDARDLLASGYKVLRPYVFFVAASQPTDPEDWPAAHERATDSTWRYYPSITAFGFQDVDGDTIQRIATVRAFLSPEINPALILREYTQSLVQSIARSAASPSPGGGIRLIMPDELPGYTVVNADPA